MQSGFAWARRHAFFLYLLLFVAVWSVVLLLIPSEAIVTYIGVENTYFAAFLLAAFTGISTFTSSSFYLSIATFAAGGAVPLILGLAGGSGAFLSNSIFYFLVLHGKRALPDRWERRIEELTKIIKKLPLWAVWIVVFVYSGLTPFPDDILIAALALSSISYLRVAPVLLAANITIVTLISYSASRGMLLF